jgi:hypothetical protein
MKKIAVFTVLFVAMVFFIALTASADPRMEICDNFCHCILDPIDTDNEVFIANCKPYITVEKSVEKIEEKSLETEKDIETQKSNECETCCDGYTANGYAKVRRRVPEVAAPLPAGQEKLLTSNDSDTPCVMVETNGRAYKSHNWESSIKVKKSNRDGMVWVVYELICFDGNGG